MIPHSVVEAHNNGDCWYGCQLCDLDPFVDCPFCSRELHVDDLCGSDDDPACPRCCTTHHGRVAA
jgi:hypothetical protein